MSGKDHIVVLACVSTARVGMTKNLVEQAKWQIEDLLRREGMENVMVDYESWEGWWEKDGWPPAKVLKLLA